MTPSTPYVPPLASEQDASEWANAIAARVLGPNADSVSMVTASRIALEARLDLLSSPPAPAGGQTRAWHSVNDWMPKDGVQVLVWRPQEDWMHEPSECFGFDMREEGVWLYHSNNYEEFMAVGGANAAGPGETCIGPSESAPYTHWTYIDPPSTPSPGHASLSASDEREAFEKWAKADGYGMSLLKTHVWAGWQARSRLSSDGAASVLPIQGDANE